MANPVTLSSMAGILIAGAGLGLYLGESAISEIDPHYFSNPISTFHADLVANPADPDRAPRLEEKLALATDLGSGCVGCRTGEAEYPAADYIVDSDSNAYTAFRTVPADTVIAQAEEFVAEAEKFVVQGPSRDEIDAVQRYAHYRVSEEEEEPALVRAGGSRAVDAGTCAEEGVCGGEIAPAI